MTFQITSIYAAIFALVAVTLSVLVSLRRAKHSVSILDGGHIDLAVAIRRHGNFIETVPLILILMAMSEARGLEALWLHATGMIVLAGRLLHALGLKAHRAYHPLKALGMAGTLLPILALAIYLLLSHM